MGANTPEEMRAVAANVLAAPREVLTLRLSNEEYGIDMLRVPEIRPYEQPTRLSVQPPDHSELLALKKNALWTKTRC